MPVDIGSLSYYFSDSCPLCANGHRWSAAQDHQGRESYCCHFTSAGRVLHGLPFLCTSFSGKIRGMPIIAEFVKSVAHLNQLPGDGLSEIALAGRSNVGKSSLINNLLRAPKLAKTSNTPGRTQMLNFYRVYPDGKASKPFYLVDMPGYGFAQVNAARREQWGRLIEEYLTTRETLRGIISLVDMRHPPQKLDIQMADWLRHITVPYLVVGTKADKIAKTKIPEHLLQIAEGMNVDSQDTLAFSAETGLNRDNLWRWILETAQG